MKRIGSTPKVTGTPRSLDRVWFQHVSPKRLDFIVPTTYKDLLVARATGMGLPAAERYVADRVVSEDRYRTALGIQNDELSFSYATVVGFNSMESPDDYPGFTYFFRMSPEQVNRTLFGAVTGDPLLQVPMETGLRGLSRALSHWARYSGLFIPADDPELGTVQPRVEVVFQFPVRPELFIAQEEDRVNPPAATSGAASSREAGRASRLRPGTLGS